MKHIIFAGCSFSDDGKMTDNFETIKYKKDMSLSDLSFPTTVKMHQLLAMDLENQEVKDVKIHTIARGSYGNHVISDMVRKKVTELKENYPDDEIFSIIQLSALFRNGLNIEIPNANVDDYPYDYITDNTALKNNFDFSILYNKHMDNIIDLKKFCDENKVESFFYFGWANIFENDVVAYKLTNKLKEIEKFCYLFEYSDVYDEIGFYCAGSKPVKLKDYSYMGNSGLYYIKSDRYGGLIEYAREKSDIGKRYHLIFDPHPNTKTYYIFYNDILKNWLNNKGIISTLPMDISYENILNKIFDFEYARFVNTTNATNSDNEKISNLSVKLIREDKITDIPYVIRKFSELNKTF